MRTYDKVVLGALAICAIALAAASPYANPWLVFSGWIVWAYTVATHPSMRFIKSNRGQGQVQ